MKNGLSIIGILLILNSCSPTKIIHSEDRYILGNKNELIYKALYFNNGLKAKVFDYKQGRISRETQFDCEGNLVKEINYHDSNHNLGFEKNNKYLNRNLIESTVITFEGGLKTDTSIVKLVNTFDGTGRLIKVTTINETDTSVVHQSYNSNGLLKYQTTIVQGDTLATQIFDYNASKRVTSKILKHFESNTTRVDHFVYADTLIASSIQIMNGDTLRVQKHFYKDGLKQLTRVTEKTKGKTSEYEIRFEYEYLPATNKLFMQCRGLSSK